MANAELDTVRVSRLFKRYESSGETREILKGVSLEVNPGQSLAIMGPSGSGKSTLLNIIGTLDTCTSGEVDIFGTNPFTLSPHQLALFRNRMIGFIFQSHHLLPQCTVLENVLLPTLVNSNPGAHASHEKPVERAKRLLERTGLTARINGYPAQLSGGERQRAAVVRALINSPRVVLADEPTGSLDHQSTDNVASLLAELKREEHVALIVVTHTSEVAARMDQTRHLRDGILTQPEA